MHRDDGGYMYLQGLDMQVYSFYTFLPGDVIPWVLKEQMM